MSQIETIIQAGYTLTVDVRNPLAGYASLATGLTVSEVTPTVYRASLGSLAGIVHCLFKSGSIRIAAGYANLDRPGSNGYSEVFDTLSEAERSGVAAFSVLPGRDRGLPQSSKNRIVVAQGELITIVRQVLDGNGSPMNLAGRTLQLVIQDARGVDVATVSSGSITISGTDNSSYSFAVPSAASAKVGNFTYSLNDVGSSKAEIVSGEWIVKQRAIADL